MRVVEKLPIAPGLAKRLKIPREDETLPFDILSKQGEGSSVQLLPYGQIRER